MIKDPSKYIKIELANNTFMNLLAFGRLADHRFAAPAPSRHAAVSTRYFVADWLKEDVERDVPVKTSIHRGFSITRGYDRRQLTKFCASCTSYKFGSICSTDNIFDVYAYGLKTDHAF